MHTATRLFAVADWHADKALKAYAERDMETYTRHIVICDRVRRQAYAVKRAA